MITLFVFAILLLFAAGIAFFAFGKMKKPALRASIPSVLVILAILLAGLSCIRTVPTGHTGIVPPSVR